MLSLYRPLTDLFRDDFLERELTTFFRPSSVAREPGFHPPVDIVDQEGAYLLQAELPGISPENIKLDASEGQLTLTGERKQDSESEDGGYRRTERRYGQFSRTFSLPEGTRVEGIEAHFDQGVLTVTIPKTVKASPRRVEVKVQQAADSPAAAHDAA